MFAPLHNDVGTKNVVSDIPEEATEQMDEGEAMLTYKQKLCRAKTTMKIYYEKQEKEEVFKEDSILWYCWGGGGGGGGGKGGGA